MTVDSSPTARSDEAAQVRRRGGAQLADLPDDDRADLLDELAAHVDELVAEGDTPLTDRLGTPAEYAAELRASAGLPPRGHGVAPARRPSIGCAERPVIRGSEPRWTSSMHCVPSGGCSGPGWSSDSSRCGPARRRRRGPMPCRSSRASARRWWGCWCWSPPSWPPSSWVWRRAHPRPTPSLGRGGAERGHSTAAIPVLVNVGEATHSRPIYLDAGTTEVPPHEGVFAAGHQVWNIYAYDAQRPDAARRRGSSTRAARPLSLGLARDSTRQVVVDAQGRLVENAFPYRYLEPDGTVAAPGRGPDRGCPAAGRLGRLAGPERVEPPARARAPPARNGDLTLA